MTTDLELLLEESFERADTAYARHPKELEAKRLEDDELERLEASLHLLPPTAAVPKGEPMVFLAKANGSLAALQKEFAALA